MNKQWKNFGIFALVLVIILVIIFFVLPNFSPTQEKLTLDQGYEKILTIFEQNDVNFSQFRELDIFSADDLGNINWKIGHSNLEKVKSELLLMKSNISSYDVDSANELSDAIGVFVYAINSAIEDNENYIKLSAYDFSKCNLTNFEEANVLLTYSYNKRLFLAGMVDEFAYNYDEYSELLVIDLDAEYVGFLESSKYILLKRNECDFE